MMYGGSWGWGWMWFGIILLVLVLVALIVLLVRLFSMDSSRRTGVTPGWGSPSAARHIAEERLARGEISPEEFGHITRALDQRGG